ncbi:hypothetical protein BHE74_00019788, partial [Ensete ventricosum]
AFCLCPNTPHKHQRIACFALLWLGEWFGRAAGLDIDDTERRVSVEILDLVLSFSSAALMRKKIDVTRKRKTKEVEEMVTRTVDLRSDTVTKPTEAMRAAMASADVDDDVLSRDPTAQWFEEEVARIMGKEAAVFVPSGTMGNLISVLVHCEVRGSEVILGDNSHIHIYENGGISTIGGVHPRTVKNNPDGTMDIDRIEAAIRHPDGELYYPTTRLICLENTHAKLATPLSLCGGRCISAEYTDKVGELAQKHGLKLHIDGARIFNASAALGVPVHRLIQAADSASDLVMDASGLPVKRVGCSSWICHCRNQGFHYKGSQFSLCDQVFFNINESSMISSMSLCEALEKFGVLAMPASSTRCSLIPFVRQGSHPLPDFGERCPLCTNLYQGCCAISLLLLLRPEMSF